MAKAVRSLCVLNGALVLLSACSTQTAVITSASDPSTAPRGQVEASLLEATATERYQYVEGVSFEQPTPFPENAVPTYPVTQLRYRLAPVSVAVRVVVNSEGFVSSVEPLGQPSEHHEFVQSVVEAVQTWRYYPLVKTVLGPERTKIRVGDATTTYNGVATALPFHQDYAFSFSQLDGRPHVDVK